MQMTAAHAESSGRLEQCDYPCCEQPSSNDQLFAQGEHVTISRSRARGSRTPALAFLPKLRQPQREPLQLDSCGVTAKAGASARFRRTVNLLPRSKVRFLSHRLFNSTF